MASARARDFAVDLGELHENLRLHIREAQKHYQKAADNRRLPPPEFKVGQKAFVKAQFFKTTRPSKKLSEKNLGPYEIIAQPSATRLPAPRVSSYHSRPPTIRPLLWPWPSVTQLATLPASPPSPATHTSASSPRDTARNPYPWAPSLPGLASTPRSCNPPATSRSTPR
jgi:hypothetical protein